MVEMSETSAILHGATARSLVLLDEIGRGTSTYDGVAIAWAVTEHLHDRIGCKTIFATHYHELTQLTERLQHARNFNVAVRESGDQIVFLHHLEPGGTDRSYGIHVGQLAGLPAEVVRRALEPDSSHPPFEPPVVTNAESPVRYPPVLFQQNIEGTVLLRLFVDSFGRLAPESTRIAESSGITGLDSAALASVPTMKIAPAR